MLLKLPRGKLIKLILKVKVNPSSKEDRIKESKNKSLMIYIKDRPENNKANIKLIKLLSRHFNISSKDIKIKSGRNSRNKIVDIKNQ